MVSADTFVACYLNSSGYPYAIAFTTTGHTINAPGSAVSGEGVVSNYPRIETTGADEFVLSWKRSSGGQVYFERMTVSGTTISSGTADPTISGIDGGADMCQLDNGVTVFLGHDNTTDRCAFKIGAGIVTGGNWEQQSEANISWGGVSQTLYPRICPVGRNLAVAYVNSSSYNRALLVIISTTDNGELKILAQKEIQPFVDDSAVTNANYDIAFWDDLQLIITQKLSGDLSGYGYANIVNVEGLIA